MGFSHSFRQMAHKGLSNNEILIMYRASQKTNDKIKRASHKSLRHEESESVWNELEYYKKEYQKYKKERYDVILMDIMM